MDSFESLLGDVPTPAIVYHLPKLRRTAAQLRDLSAPFGGICAFAVKANRNPRVLAELAAAGFGADIASTTEYTLADAAGLRPLMATSPGLPRATAAVIDKAGGAVFFDHIEQVRLALEDGIDLSRHGIRASMPGDYRAFGFEIPAEAAALEALGFRPKKLHVHAGEIIDPGRLLERLRVVEGYVRRYDASVVDMGGGFGVLSNDPGALTEAFAHLHAFSARTGVKLIFEFGKVAVARCGYLVTRVLGTKSRGEARCAVVDASSFNLGTWEPRRVIWTSARGSRLIPTRIMGPTCYESDIFVDNAALPELRPGDRIVFGPVGAYTMSISASLHGLETPREEFFG